MPIKPMRPVKLRRPQVVMPTSQSSTPPRSLRSSTSSLDSLSSTINGTQSDSAIYIGTVKHIHHYYPRPRKAKRKQGLPSSAPVIDSRPSWRQHGERFARRLQPAFQIALAIIIFCASRVSLGFGVRLND